MAGSRFAYVRKYELSDALLPGTFMVLRIDGHAFHRCVVLRVFSGIFIGAHALDRSKVF